MSAREQKPREPVWFRVPVGTELARCRAIACGKPIYWILTPLGKRMPVDVNVPGGAPPQARVEQDGAEVLPERDGRGVAHWGTCAAAADFRRAKL